MSKLRITTFDAVSGRVTSDEKGTTVIPGLIIKEDRLVEMSTEFRNGPKEKHTGPIRVEALLSTTEEVQSFITYLNQLALGLPLPEKTQRAYKKKDTPMKEDSIQELITHIKTSPKLKTQEDVIDYLRSLNFVMVTMEHWYDIQTGLPIPGMETAFKEKHGKYQIMLRQLKLAKDPKNDKYDPQILFLIKLLGSRTERIHVYVDGEYKTTTRKDWKEIGEIGLKVKQKFYKFNSSAMDYEERAKWRAEDRKVQLNPNYEPTKFYYKWLPHVTILQPQAKKGIKK